MKNSKLKTKSVISLATIIFLFFLVSLLVQNWLGKMNILTENIILSAIVFVLLTTIESVLAPLSVFPLVPLASSLFGWVMTAVFLIIGWTLGSWIAFIISRKYGKPLVKKIVSLEEVEKLEKKLPEKHLFITIVLLRMFIPVDFLSYALGLFSKIKTSTYLSATIIGLTPFAFVMAYLGIVPLLYQIIGIIIGGGIIIIGARIIVKKLDKNMKGGKRK